LRLYAQPKQIGDWYWKNAFKDHPALDKFLYPNVVFERKEKPNLKKRCSQCSKMKPLDQFRPNPAGKYGVGGTCLECFR